MCVRYSKRDDEYCLFRKYKNKQFIVLITVSAN